MEILKLKGTITKMINQELISASRRRNLQTWRQINRDFAVCITEQKNK